MKLKTGSLVALLLVSVAFFFVLACLDYLLMANFSFWRDPDTLYRYWVILWLIVIVFGFALSFMAYISEMKTAVCLGLLATVVLLFAGGLLDQFYALFCFLQNQEYSFANWSFQAKVLVGNGLLPLWDWPEQIIWSAVFYGAIVAIWYFVLRRK